MAKGVFMSPEVVRRIYKMKDHGAPAKDIAEIFDVSTETIRRVWRQENYAVITRKLEGEEPSLKWGEERWKEEAKMAEQRILGKLAQEPPQVTISDTARQRLTDLGLPIPGGDRQQELLVEQIKKIGAREAAKQLKERFKDIDPDADLPDASVNPWA